MDDAARRERLGAYKSRLRREIRSSCALMDLVAASDLDNWDAADLIATVIDLRERESRFARSLMAAPRSERA